MIKVKNLHKTFGDLNVLAGIDEHITQGEVVVVIGPSGSGKSTFLRCLNLLEKPTDGEIFIDDEQINSKKANVNLIRQKMGMVFQQFNLFPHLTIIDNITLAPVLLKKMSKEDAIKKEWNFSQGLVFQIKQIPIPTSFQADRNSVLQLPVLSLWNLK